MKIEELACMNTAELFKMAETEEGKTAILDAVKNALDADPTACEAIISGLCQFVGFAEKVGTNLAQRQDEIFTFLTACQRLSELPEDEARSLIQAAFREEDGEDLPQEEVDEIIQLINYKRPDSLTMPTAKVIRKLYDGITDFTNGIQPVDISPRTQKGKYVVPVEIFVSAMADDGFQLQHHLTPYDRQVQNGIFTLLENGYTAFTAKQVYEAFAGKTTTSGQAIGHVTRSIKKQRSTLISIDWTAHAQMKGLPIDQAQGDYVTTEENLLMLRRVRLQCNGQYMDGYCIIETPVLYRYSKLVGQLSTIDKKLLNVPINNTEKNIIIRNELLERIDTMKKRKGRISNNILFESLYGLVGASESRTETNRIRKAINAMLEAWKDEGFIIGFVYNEEKNKKASVTIEV